MTTAPAQDSIAGPLRRYQISAYVIGVLLIVACGFSISEHVFDAGEGRWLWLAHGWFGVVYLGFAFDLFRRRSWPLMRLVQMVVSGWIPGLTFVMERRIVALVAAGK
ncbi:MAG: DUF3817 domain-containing protein [Sporichthyaceae bacterium]|jgi:integral membrane protein